MLNALQITFSLACAEMFNLTSKEGNVGVLGIIRTARHSTDLLSLSLQGVNLRSGMR